MIQLVEIYRLHNEYRLREVYINPKHIVAMRQDDRMQAVLQEGNLPDELDNRQDFTKLYVDRGHTGIDMSQMLIGIMAVGLYLSVQNRIRDYNFIHSSTKQGMPY